MATSPLVPTPRDDASTHETLQALILRRLSELGDDAGPMSFRRAAARSHSMVGHESLRRLAMGLHSGDISDRIAAGQSLALEVPQPEIYRAAGVVQPSGRWELPARFDRVPVNVRAQFEGLIAAYLDALES